MEYIRIDEKKWAIIILLEKIKDMYAFEFPSDARPYNKDKEEAHSHSINEFVVINGTTYKIEHDIFKNVMSDLESDGMIKIINDMPMSIVELISNPLVYANEESKRNSTFSIEDLDKDIIFEYEIVLKDLKKITKKIASMNSAGVYVNKISVSHNRAGSLDKNEKRKKQ